MQLEFVPLLQIQRDLYAMPRNMERFRAYLKAMTNAETGDLDLPLVAMNPMGKEHVAVFLDGLIGLQADQAGEAAVASVRGLLKDDPGTFRVGIVVADDAGGGWTNRYAFEFSHRFEEMAMYKRGWIVALVWTSEAPAVEFVREEVASCVIRAAYIQRHGRATTLRAMLQQEGEVLALAGCEQPALDGDDLEYTRQVIEPLLDATDRATLMACLFGDDAATALGYRAHGLSPRAGLALALHQARTASASSRVAR